MSSITLRFLAEPSTVNFGGNVHGGTVMKWIDEAGYACATRWAKRYCVTVFVGGIRFHHPVRIGELVEVEARLAYTGNTSMNISVEVRSGDMKAGELKTTTECLIVFVSVDEKRQACARHSLEARNARRHRAGPAGARAAGSVARGGQVTS